MTEDQAAHRAAVEAGYAPLKDYVGLPHAIPIRHDVFMHFKEIAERENAPSVACVINDELRKRMGER